MNYAMMHESTNTKYEIMSLSIQVSNGVKLQFARQCVLEVELHSFLTLTPLTWRIL